MESSTHGMAAVAVAVGVTVAAVACGGASPRWLRWPSTNSKSWRNMPIRCSSRPIISGCTQLSKITFAPSKPICGLKRAGTSCTCSGALITAQGRPRRLALWRSICVPSTSSGAAAAMAASTAR